MPLVNFKFNHTNTDLELSIAFLCISREENVRNNRISQNNACRSITMYWNATANPLRHNIRAVALKSELLQYCKSLFKLCEFLRSVNTNITALWLVTPCSLVVISTNVLVASKVTAKRLLLPSRSDRVPEMSVLMHQCTSAAVQTKWTSVSCNSLFLAVAHGAVSALVKAKCPCAKYEGMRDGRSTVVLTLNPHTKRVSGPASRTSRFTAMLSAPTNPPWYPLRMRCVGTYSRLGRSRKERFNLILHGSCIKL